MNILLVEDEPTLAESAIAQMESRGHTVHYAKDLEGAHNILKDQSFTIQLIIADHNLPDGLGVDFAIAVKGTYPRMESAIVSGCLTPADVERLELVGIPYFHKPLLYAKVLDRLRRLKAERAATRPPIPTEEKTEES
ncbi:MAG: response regulator [Verrucomicrobiota bacterium]